jgi:hypothetical protein
MATIDDSNEAFSDSLLEPSITGREADKNFITLLALYGAEAGQWACLARDTIYIRILRRTYSCMQR